MQWLYVAHLCGLALQGGILEKYNVELIGAKLPSIDKAEDRELFKQAWIPTHGARCNIH